MTFKPYTPPCAGNGPLTLERDLCWRINPDQSDKVTPAVVGAVAYLFVHGLLNDKQKVALLDGLGLEWKQGRMGDSVLQPRVEFFQPVEA